MTDQIKNLINEAEVAGLGLVIAMIPLVGLYVKAKFAALTAGQKAAADRDEAARKLAESTASAAKDAAVIAKDTHTLVNSNMGDQLRVNAKTTRELANVTEDTTHEANAVAAETLLMAHEAKQAAVDLAKKG